MRDTTHTVLHVGAWQVEPDLCRISMPGKRIVLQPRWMDVLLFLSKNAGTVVSADEIMENVWGSVEVTQDSVYVTVSHLRKELAKDPAHAAYIETIAKRGYRLVAPVEFPETPEEAGMMGEVIVSYPQTVRQAAEHRWPVEQELALLIVHGILHLFGFDHAEPEQEAAMKALEEQALARLGTAEVRR